MELHSPISSASTHSFSVSQNQHAMRADKVITQHFTDYSRSFLKRLFKEQCVLLNNKKICKPSTLLHEHDTVHIQFPETLRPIPHKTIPQDIGVKIIALHQDFLVINKPAGLIVHPPNQYCQEVTLSDWLVQQYEDIAHIGTIDRPGIVHRLDKDTSGLMIIPRTNKAHTIFSQLFKAKEIQKTYIAIVEGTIQETLTIDHAIMRHPTHRYKMTHTPYSFDVPDHVKPAWTMFTAHTYFDKHTLVTAHPKTGRTHQIRVHAQSTGHSLASDPLYGKPSPFIQRHALHAYKLAFMYENKSYEFLCPLADDMRKALAKIDSESKYTVHQTDFYTSQIQQNHPQ